MSEDSTTPENFTFPRAAVAAFRLGFIDAGYSGDWSRIGAISKESEELLKCFLKKHSGAASPRRNVRKHV
ncbi:unnamed protein product [Malus baccata var. baccata]|uniref:DUF7887 domain-containing protein n=1 Tax=Malus domestica TaxID=3750 RepID=A0A498K2U7_MALDO|nr:hypothetical protein DVH24_015007 [Malus domestica]